ncbi:hypothetical protein L3Q82_002160 [Scortum barcoo]|uniref:Uncharacterized protein n=1 Tax=Scortum barcoo TaxID=214431 RepID=A0ACB8W2E9_9TELE|nr:hypothetical protein L3Q82_002160 [Scortum barcoo]
MKGVVQTQTQPLTSSADSEGFSVGLFFPSRLTSHLTQETEAERGYSIRGPLKADEKAVDGGLLPDANGKDPNPGGQTEGSKWQRPRLSRKSLMKCCLVKWIIASTTQQGPVILQYSCDSDLELSMVRHQPEGLDQLQAQTQFTRKELQSLYRGFKNDFVIGLSVLLRGSVTEKLRWAFNLYDINKDGYITKEKMDRNRDGVVTIDEFIETCQKDENIMASMQLFENVI